MKRTAQAIVAVAVLLILSGCTTYKVTLTSPGPVIPPPQSLHGLLNISSISPRASPNFLGIYRNRVSIPLLIRSRNLLLLASESSGLMTTKFRIRVSP